MADEVAALLAKSRLFSLPSVENNTKGWGPTSTPSLLTEAPYAPFQKADKLGRVSDWLDSGKRGYYKNNNRMFGAGTGGFGYTQEFAESEFAVVDNTPRAKARDGRRRYIKFSISNKRRRGRGGYRRFDNGRGYSVIHSFAYCCRVT